MNKTDNIQELAINIMLLVKKEGVPEITRQTGEWTVYEYREDPRPTMRFYIDPRNRASVSVRLNANGTVSRRGLGLKPSDTHDQHTFGLHQNMKDEVQKKLLRWLHRRTAPGDLANCLMSNDWAGKALKETIEKTSHKIAQECAKKAIDQGQVIEDPGEVSKRLQKRWYKTFSMDNIKSLVRWHISHEQCSLSAYNHIVINLDTFTVMLRDSPNVIRYHASRITPPPERAKSIGSPERVTREVRKELGATQAEWRYFCRIGSSSDPARTSLGLRALKGANCPQAPVDLLSNVMNLDHQYYAQARWEHGDPWQAWTHVLGTALRDAAKREVKAEAGIRMLRGKKKETITSNFLFHPHTTGIQRISDALRHHVENNIPWGKTTWQGCLNRSNRWHQQMEQDQDEKMARKLAGMKWESALGTVNIHGLQAEPVLTGEELHQLGRRMHNCLASFADRCMQGDTRIFTLRENGVLVAIAEIRRDGENGPWIKGQLEAPSRGKIPQKAEIAHQELKDMYEASERTRQ